jgi:hypothetical protein
VNPVVPTDEKVSALGAPGRVVTFPHRPTDVPPDPVAVTSTQYVVAPLRPDTAWEVRTAEPQTEETAAHEVPRYTFVPVKEPGGFVQETVNPAELTEENEIPTGAAGSVDAFVHAYVVDPPPADHASTAMQYDVSALNPTIEYAAATPSEWPVTATQLIP